MNDNANDKPPSKNAYGVDFPLNTKDVSIEKFFIQHGGYFTNSKGEKKGEGLFHHYKALQTLYWPWKKWSRWDNLLLENFINEDFVGLAGPASCVSGDTKILDPLTGIETTIEDLHRKSIAPTVMTLFGPAKATIPIIKGFQKLYTIKTKNGNSFTCSASHRVLSNEGYRSVSSIQVGSKLLSYEPTPLKSNSDTSLSGFSSSDLRCKKKAQGSQFGYPAYLRSCDAPLHAFQDTFQGETPLQVYAPEYRECAFFCSDGLGHKHLYNRTPLLLDHPSSCNEVPSFCCKENASSNYSFEETALNKSGSFQPLSTFELKTSLLAASLKSFHDFFHTPSSAFFGGCNCVGSASCDGYKVQLDVVQEIIEEPPQFYYDLTVPVYSHYFAQGAIHHNSSKTHNMAAFGLTYYSIWPNETTVLISSTGTRELELRIWGEIKMLWAKAKRLYPTFPGNITQSKLMITTDGKEVDGRDMRNGLIGIPCVVAGNFVGIGKFVGLKNKRIILLGDEFHLMQSSMLDSVSNLRKNPKFKLLGSGNPKDRTDPLGVICEPSTEEGGWDGLSEEEITKTWRTRYGGVCVQLVGTDSPNFDVPEGEKPPFPHLIKREDIQKDLELYGRDSIQFSMMNLGMFPKGSSSRRVITRQMCEQFKALESPVWSSSKITKVAGLDAAYSGIGGDRCVFIEGAFGEDISGTSIFAIKPPLIVPVNIKDPRIPEDQIAEFVMKECISRGIPPENLGFDSTGKGSLGTSFARIWSNLVNPVEFGGKPSERPVSSQIKVLCREYYSKFVSELWYSVRYCIEAGQFRGMTDDILNEGSAKEWTVVAGNRIEIEPKEKTKKRIGRSSDLFDGVVVAFEMARRKGFQIGSINNNSRNNNLDWLKELQSKSFKLRTSKQLTA